jgi:hypothetical protein
MKNCQLSVSLFLVRRDMIRTRKTTLIVITAGLFANSATGTATKRVPSRNWLSPPCDLPQRGRFGTECVRLLEDAGLEGGRRIFVSAGVSGEQVLWIGQLGDPRVLLTNLESISKSSHIGPLDSGGHCPCSKTRQAILDCPSFGRGSIHDQRAGRAHGIQSA